MFYYRSVYARILNTKLTTTAINKKKQSIVGPKRSSYGPDPLNLMALALQWYVTKAYTMVNMAINVNKPAETLPIESPKFKRPTPSDPKMTVKLSHDKNVLSLAKNTLGSTLAGRAILLF
ncbi:hypothetical protein QFC19_003816 [Naganishia cerealis]|uniref:Uncharacterized protein n=1 Tax=Naganishia cerealis TaxID=610337 RepID=A0ACC2W0L0_9TREE|nr:hypothetical protein QFC19_003816 [Naganishia cerealis]